MVNAYHDITLTFHDGVDGGSTQTAGKDTVVRRRAATALQVTEDGYAYVVLGIFVLYMRWWNFLTMPFFLFRGIPAISR